MDELQGWCRNCGAALAQEELLGRRIGLRFDEVADESHIVGPLLCERCRQQPLSHAAILAGAIMDELQDQAQQENRIRDHNRR